MKIRIEISEIETNKIIENSSKTKIWFFERETKLTNFSLIHQVKEDSINKRRHFQLITANAKDRKRL